MSWRDWTPFIPCPSVLFPSMLFKLWVLPQLGPEDKYIFYIFLNCCIWYICKIIGKSCPLLEAVRGVCPIVPRSLQYACSHSWAESVSKLVLSLLRVLEMAVQEPSVWVWRARRSLGLEVAVLAILSFLNSSPFQSTLQLLTLTRMEVTLAIESHSGPLSDIIQTISSFCKCHLPVPN